MENIYDRGKWSVERSDVYMNPLIEMLADEIVRGTRLDKQASEEIRRELLSDLHERFLDLQAQGLSDNEIVSQIKSSFGTSDMLSPLFHDAHRPFFSLRSFVTYAGVLSILSILTGFIYLVLYQHLEVEVGLWGFLMLGAGIGAYFASVIGWRHPLLRLMAAVGFLFILLAQYLPVYLWGAGIIQGFACLSDGSDNPCVGYAGLRILPHITVVIFALISLMQTIGLHPRPIFSSETTVTDLVINKGAKYLSATAAFYLTIFLFVLPFLSILKHIVDLRGD